MNKLRILTADDDPDILDVIVTTLEDEFEVIKASDGKEALRKITQSTPDIVILDYNMPDLTGIEVCQELRKDPIFLHLPVLMLTGKGETEDKVTGLNAGADDYMVKPFVPDELIARVRMLIRRSRVNLDANPLTRLPGNITLNQELKNYMGSKKKFAVLYLDLNNFKALNDYYGFDRGDEVIKEFSRILIKIIQEKGRVNDFIGHIGGDDFIIITSPEKAEEIAKNIINIFDKTAPQFYDEKDRTKGYIETKDRNNQPRQFPFTGVAIGIITNVDKKFSHVAEISSIGAELKRTAKESSKSAYVFERRISP